MYEDPKPETVGPTGAAEDVAEAEPPQTSHVDVSVDEYGVTFDGDYCSTAKEPFYGSGPRKGQWKKRKGVSEDVYDEWHAAQREKAHRQEPASLFDSSAAFSTQEPEDSPQSVGDLMTWISKRQAAKEITYQDVQDAYNAELKHLLVTVSPDAELMVRLVLRSPGQLPRVHELAGPLRRALPGLRVLSVNLQPEHKAVLEGPEEMVLTEQDTLPMRVNDRILHLGTRSFFQTNTEVAAALYAQVAQWVDGLNEGRGSQVLWDLYCGVGGFALHCSAPGRQVLGVEVSEQAVASAQRSAAELGLDGTHFRAGDATSLLSDGPAAVDQGRAGGGTVSPDTVIVNPPRRGLGQRLAEQLEAGSARHLIYSSCNATSLALDLARMPSWQVEAARLFDMFPQTDHHEVAVLLRRRPTVG